MNYFILLIIVPFFSIMIDGPELCFDNDGDIHLSCCCKNEISIKRPCCKDDCSKVKIETANLMSFREIVEYENSENNENKDFENFLNSVISNQNYFLSCPVTENYKTKTSGILSKLSKTILRC